jgi:biotin carboxyl carrier protein
MKMENEVRAPRSGVVAKLSVEVGVLVDRGDDLISLA